jgi:hypothetical protein
MRSAAVIAATVHCGACERQRLLRRDCLPGSDQQEKQREAGELGWRMAWGSRRRSTKKVAMGTRSSLSGICRGKPGFSGGCPICGEAGKG